MINLEGEIANIWLFTLSIWFIMLSFILFWFRWCQTYFWTLKCHQMLQETLKMSQFFTLRRGGGGYETYQYFILLFFTLSVEGERSEVNDTNSTLSAVFFWLSSLSWCAQLLSLLIYILIITIILWLSNPQSFRFLSLWYKIFHFTE